MKQHFRERKNATPGSRWEGRQQVDGKGVSVYARTQVEAERKLRAAVALLEQGQRRPDQRRTTAVWFCQWLDADVRPRLRPQTVVSYVGTVERYIVPVIGSVPVAKLAKDDIDRVLAKGLSRTTER